MSTEIPAGESSVLPDDLPPVQPPSAAFIAQLFLVPGLIVLAIIILWLLVSRMARVEQDWRSLVADIQSSNENIRWRGIFGLAQQLQAEQSSKTPGLKLRDNASVAQQLSDLLVKELKKGPSSEEVIQQQAILSRTLGLFHTPDVVLPSLIAAAAPDQDPDVRKNALGSIAVLAGRAFEEGTPLQSEIAETAVIEATQDENSLIRKVGTFTLGLFASPRSRERLNVLVGDGDTDVRLNAAIGLARSQSLEGLDVLKEVLRASIDPGKQGSAEEYEGFLKLKNSLQALQLLVTKLSADQKAELTKLLEPIAGNYREPKLRIDAQQLLKGLGAQ